jgi:uncharacterized membrane protein
VNISESPPERPEKQGGIAFRWRYVLLPLVLLAVSLLLVAVFYGQLPDEPAYRFLSDGSPDRWTGRGTLVFWLLLPQMVCTLAALLVARGIVGLIRRYRVEDSILIRPQTAVTLMAGMFALPQAVFLFALADIFSYNLYQIHLLPLWIFSVIVLGAGAVVLGIYFFRMLNALRKTGKEQTRD